MNEQSKNSAQTSIDEQAADWYANMQSTDADKAGFAKWRLADAAHAKAYDALGKMWSASEGLANDSDILAQLGNIPSASSAKSRTPWYYTGAAAAVLIMSFLGLFLTNNQTQTQNYATTIDQQQIILLDDGTTITLDANSQLQVAMSNQNRDVQLLKGRARFNVAKDPQRPFVVSTDTGSVRALGTIFDVNKNKQLLHVALLEGRVEVAPKQATDTIQKQVMTAGHQTTVSSTQGVAKPTPMNQDQPQDWTNGILQFNATPLDVAVEEFNRYLKKPLRIRGKNIADLQITGSFSTKEPQKIISALTTIFPLEAVTSNKFVMLTWDPKRHK